ncbi:hypothetical protein TNCT_205371 [Trichonephila clavata]|uniref:Uncharacterized protein n=1 Tax=Trichonephila clavata TaxID=2740835 RepID=A0A8X6G7H7_TRICU|nr:hypothetical protein TNCT_205371 [Trichonephila clavata]
MDFAVILLRPDEMPKSMIEGLALWWCGILVGSVGAEMQNPQFLVKLNSWAPPVRFPSLFLGLKQREACKMSRL